MRIDSLDCTDLSPYWADLKAIAKERHEQKKGYASSRYWNLDSHLIGIAGEALYAMKTGQRVDRKLRAFGDEGSDFPDGADVKTCTYRYDPILKHPVWSKKWPALFVFCFVDPKKQEGMIVGYATPEMLRGGPVRDFGHGDQFTLDADKLLPAPSAPYNEGEQGGVL